MRIPTLIRSLLTSPPSQRTEKALDNLLPNPKHAEENTDTGVEEKFQGENDNANDDTNDYSIEGDENTKSHDYLSLMVNDYFLKLQYML